MSHISRWLKWCGDSLTHPSGNRTWTVPHTQTHHQGSQAQHLLFRHVPNSALVWLPPHELPTFNGGHLPQKATNAANTQSFTFSIFLPWKTKQPDKILDMILCVEAVQLTRCSKTLCSTDWHFQKKILDVIKSVCLNLTDHNSTTISPLVSTPFCVIFLWEIVSVLILKTVVLSTNCSPLLSLAVKHYVKNIMEKTNNHLFGLLIWFPRNKINLISNRALPLYFKHIHICR